MFWFVSGSLLPTPCGIMAINICDEPNVVMNHTNSHSQWNGIIDERMGERMC